LSRETRRPSQVAYNRLFEIFLFGLPVAALVSLVSVAAGGRANLSNYLPFLAGINVAFNNFPANPTSWYLGTYIHVIALWALFGRRIRVSPVLLVLALVVEIVVRALLIQTVGRFVAYMVVPNWMTVILLGYWYGQQDALNGIDRAVATGRSFATNARAAGTLVLLVAVWTMFTRQLPLEPAFPLMRLRVDPPLAGALLVSVMVSAIYVSATWLVFLMIDRVPTPPAIRFIARNTLIIFLAHMPVYFLLAPRVAGLASPVARSAVFLAVCLPGLALVSEGVRRLVRPRELRERLYQSSTT
jgi:hypothetical protein